MKSFVKNFAKIFFSLAVFVVNETQSWRNFLITLDFNTFVFQPPGSGARLPSISLSSSVSDSWIELTVRVVFTSQALRWGRGCLGCELAVVFIGKHLRHIIFAK